MRLFLLTITSAILFANAAFAGEKTVRIEVTGLYCASCPYIAARAITSVDSAKITDGFYDPEQQLAQFVITYDDEVTSPQELATATIEYGYPATIIDEKAKGS